MFCCDGVLNMTSVGLNLSPYVNGVTKNHGAVSQHLFAGYGIDSITNGGHAATWTAPPFQALYDRSIRGWRQDNFNLRYALSLPKPDVWQAHLHAKKKNSCYCDCCATARPTVSRTWATGNGLKIYSKTHRRAPSSTASSEA